MKDTCNLSEFQSFTRARRIAAGVMMLLALTLAGPPRLAAQCDQNTMPYPTLTSPGSIMGGSTQTATVTVTVNNNGGGGALIPISATYLNLSGNFWFGDLIVPTGSVASFTVSSGDVAQPTTLYISASDGPCGATVPITITPNAPTLSLSPSVVLGDATQTVRANVTITGAAGSGGIVLSTMTSGLNVIAGSNFWFGDITIPAGQSSGYFDIAIPVVTQDTKLAIAAGVLGINLSSSRTLEIRPPGYVANAADLGVMCKACQELARAGEPINLTNGNVWIEHHDYAVPGLGGGLELSRVWNSQWYYSNPPTLAGMFGYGWRSTYEEQLMPLGSQTFIYWRGDGSGWTFTYNSALNTYALSSPPDERAQLVMNPGTGAFTLTLADGTQRTFNAQGLLAAVIDRNNNQTTLAYDTTNRLTSVTSAGGSTLTFSYGDPNNSTQVTTLADAVGTVATYTYDSSSRLTMVTYADGSKLNFTFDANSNITAVTDSQGKLLESHTYDSQNRGLTSSRAYGVDSVSLTY